MKIAEYKPDHLININVDFDKYPICRGNMGILSNILVRGISRSILTDDGDVLAVISVLEIHKTTATVYIVPSEDAHGLFRTAFIKGVFSLRKELDFIMFAHGYRRLETLTVDEPKHNRWMQYLGFAADGVKRCYGLNGEDFIMWSKLWV